ILRNHDASAIVHPSLEPDPQFGETSKVVRARRKGSRERHRVRGVLSPAAIALLLSPNRLDSREIAYKQHADSRWTAKLVSTGGNEIGVGQRKLAGRLRAVRQQKRSRLANHRRQTV